MYKNRSGLFGFASRTALKPASVHSWHTFRTVSNGIPRALKGVMATVLQNLVNKSEGKERERERETDHMHTSAPANSFFTSSGQVP
jgi:hypothetical protein